MADTVPKTYDTPLTPDAEKAFGLAYPDPKSTADYDMRGAWKAGIVPSDNGHMPDTFKKPNHITFSSESIYSGHDGNEGGQWGKGDHGEWVFAPGPTNLANHTPQQLQDYFATSEPDARLDLPQPSALDILFPGKK